MFPESEKHLSVATCGPGGTGKATLCLMLMTLYPAKYEVVGSYTTREPKVEIHRKKYVHCKREEFIKLKNDGKIMESNDYAGKNLYGTSRDSYDEIITSGKIPLFDVDIHGAQQLRNSLVADEFLVFFLDCEIEEIQRRLEHRGAENEQQIQDRVGVARKELRAAKPLRALNIINEIVPYGIGADAEKTALGMNMTIDTWAAKLSQTA